jgi:REP element-mobilizing transposase RayT
VHITLRVREELGNLRRKRPYRAIEAALGAGKRSPGFRLVHFSVQRDHLHLIVEAKDREALSRGTQGLSIRVAKALNKARGRHGTVFADRHHDRPLKTPSEVRNALRYVYNNFRKHREVLGGLPPDLTDECSSAPWFDGWKPTLPFHVTDPPPVAEAHTWLLHTGWRRHGLIRPWERPG